MRKHNSFWLGIYAIALFLATYAGLTGDATLFGIALIITLVISLTDERR